MAYNFEPGKRYDFSVWPDVVLGTNFRGIECDGVAGYRMAGRYIDIDASHRSVYPYLPEGSSDRPEDYKYLIYSTMGKDGKPIMTAIGIPWIKEETIREVSGVDFDIQIRGESLDTMERMRLVMAQNNVQNYNIVKVTR